MWFFTLHASCSYQDDSLPAQHACSAPLAHLGSPKQWNYGERVSGSACSRPRTPGSLTQRNQQPLFTSTKETLICMTDVHIETCLLFVVLGWFFETFCFSLILCWD